MARNGVYDDSPRGMVNDSLWIHLKESKLRSTYRNVSIVEVNTEYQKRSQTPAA